MKVYLIPTIFHAILCALLLSTTVISVMILHIVFPLF